jgi:hypothetical protein
MAQRAQAVREQAIEDLGIQRGEGGQQLTLSERWMARARRGAADREEPLLCAGCRQSEARYGFRAEEAEPGEERPRTLCFSCFRIELNRRQAVQAQLARGWNAEQARLPLEQTLRELTRRRRRAQIAARHALGA